MTENAGSNAARSMTRSVHWDGAYRAKSSTQLGWYQADPEPSFGWIRELAPNLDAGILDVGGGASVLADRLLDAGYAEISVLDVSEAALAVSKVRLGELSSKVSWIAADITRIDDVGRHAVWHDRAVFHFLTAEDDRRRYVELAHRSVDEAGGLIVAAFALDGPATCSGLPVERYDERSLADAFRPHFVTKRAERRIHVTPSGAAQPFIFLQMVPRSVDS